MADYTALTQTDVETILTHYDLPDLTQKTAMPGGQANSSFKITCGNEVYILSVCDEKSPEAVSILIRTLAYLNRHGFPTSRPILTRNQDPFVLYHGKPVYIKAYMAGQVMPVLSSAMVFDVGKTMAALHQITPPPYVPDQFPYGQTSFQPVIESGMDHPYLSWLKEQKTYIETHLDTTSEKGLIHGDIYWDNLLFDNGSLKALLDFEEVCKYYLLYDIAMTCVGCCSQNGRFDTIKIRSLLSGYQSINPLSAKAQNQLSLFAVYAATAGSFWRFQQYNIKFPGHEKADSYMELAALADQALKLDWPNLATD